MSENNEGKITEVEENLEPLSKDIYEENHGGDIHNQEWKCIEEPKKKKSNVIKFLMFFIVGVGVLVGAAFLGMKGYEATQGEENPNNTANLGTTENEQELGQSPDVVLNSNQVINLVHEMSNSIIVAQDGEIWGKKSITKDNIEDVLASTKGIDDYLFTEISKWQSLDFSNAVEVHNYVWSELKGTIGRATGLNNDEIEKVKQQLQG